MGISIKLQNDYGYKWEEYEGNYAKGFAFLNGELYTGKQLIKMFLELEDFENIDSIMPKLQGIFALVIQKDGDIYLIEDITRTFPLFYAKAGDDIIITDDTFYLRDKLNAKFNPDFCAEFLRCLYVTGPYTLLDGIYQVQAGEIVHLSQSGDISGHFYYDYTVKRHEITTKPVDKLSQELYTILNRVIDRLIDYANGRTIVIPLSGGYDSRVIATLLTEKGYDDVICYTYGRRDSSEVNTAKDVAGVLGCEWIYVEITDEIVPSGYPYEDWFIEFYKFAFNHVSTIHLQDFFVFRHLIDNDLIPNKAIVVPGHSGDFLGGSHLRKLLLPKSREDVWKRALAMHYILNEHIKLPNSVRDKFWQYLNRYPDDVLVYSLDDNWNMVERQAKFIINSNRAYEFFGYEHAVPLWDIELVEFFRRLPIELKYTRVLYNEVLENRIFKPMGVLIKQDEKAFTLREKFYRRVFKAKGIFKNLRYFAELHLPYQIKRPLRDFVWPDENNMKVVATPILRELNRKYSFSEFHGIVAEWCLKRAKCSIVGGEDNEVAGNSQ
ncbi:asparagine synthetase B family protein [Thermococcus indicus]|uniref:Asparagine synthetase B family protein n=1 Tax=Thermococcus indicus TaxID=2586643 RepID=A0A4Y5SKN1_9EURY|nr:asparagine synthetase B family protein [Thermococcus indicus]QDA30611.1 asparagine synthetase B family protein [Thermococcus indicus]